MSRRRIICRKRVIWGKGVEWAKRVKSKKFDISGRGNFCEIWVLKRGWSMKNDNILLEEKEKKKKKTKLICINFSFNLKPADTFITHDYYNSIWLFIHIFCVCLSLWTKRAIEMKRNKIDKEYHQKKGKYDKILIELLYHFTLFVFFK